MRVVFRVDSSRLIGTGHLVRCLTLATTLRERGAEVEFISRAHAGSLLARVAAEDFATTALPAPPARADSSSENDAEDYAAWLGVPQAEDASQTIEALAGSTPDWLVVDHYGLDAEWEGRLRPHVGRILAIDDLADRAHDCDVLLDQNYFAEPESRYRDLVPPGCRLLVGPRYALLRPEYREYRAKPNGSDGEIRRVLVFLGGTDRHGVSAMALEALSAPELAHLHVDVVVGANNADRARIEELSTTRGNTIIQGPRPHLADLMWTADLAVGAGGATTWERMCLGLPSVVVSVAENQRPVCEALARAGLVEYVGEATRISGGELRTALEALVGEPDRVARLAASSLLEVDGLGATRVAEGVETVFPARRGLPRGEGGERMGSPVTVLFLGPADSPLIEWLKVQGERVIQISEELSADWVASQKVDFLVSYGYRHILDASILDQFPDCAINLHISYLPWNRGADPNLWSFVENTRKGVTIHHMDEGVDTGDIIVQEEVEFDPDSDTLATSYDKLHETIQDLFKRNWRDIKAGTCPRQPQPAGGSFHRRRDKDQLSHVLADRWQTPVSVLTGILEDEGR